jgi:rhamnogalacturonan endolyase
METLMNWCGKDFLWLMACVMLAVGSAAWAAGDVSLTINGQPAKPGDHKPQDIEALVISTGDVTITFAKDPSRATLANPRGGGGAAGRDPAKDFSAVSVVVKGKEIGKNLHGVEPRDVNARRSFYLDSYTGTDLLCDTVKVLANTPEMAHFAVCNEPNPSNSPHLEHHFVMLKGESGIHPYVIISGNQTGEMRTMYKFDMSILDWAWTNERTGRQTSYADLQAISPSGNAGDETWRKPDGSPFADGTTVYTKYNYVSFYYLTPMWGHYGHGVGAWFIPTSPESYASGPLRQDLDVHQDALILNYLGGGHLGSGGTAAGLNGRPKIHGPWYLYFNTADSNESLIADALKTAAAEKAKWPYQWVEEPTYPLNRTMVTGQIKISHNRSAANAWVVLGQPGAGGRGGRGVAGGVEADRASALLNQAGDCIFFVHADDKGKFTIPAVRPGTYTLYVWQDQGPICQSLAVDGIEIKGDRQDLSDVAWDPPYHPTLLFQIGKPDRLAGEYKLGNWPREVDLIRKVPQYVDFFVGKSKEAEDWYFAQNGGTWTVHFNVEKVPAGNCCLTIPVAGGGGTCSLAVNGTSIGTISKPNDSVLARQANRAGVYGRPAPVTFPANLLKVGENVLTLQGSGMMYDTVVLEGD